ncbi:SRSO17 transposase [Paraburkholderia sp. WSM4179]|nr:SRSO17 transposase [Paraburkholderia sp. WSM4179]
MPRTKSDDDSSPDGDAGSQENWHAEKRSNDTHESSTDSQAWLFRKSWGTGTHHFVSKSEWSDAALLERVRRWVLPHMNPANGLFWIVDDKGFPKQGKHSVGVARQYCGQLGKQDNCQVAVSLSVATEDASLPVAYQLYLPREWSEDTARCQRAGVPDEVAFSTKPQMAAAQLRQARESGAPDGLCWRTPVTGTTASFVTPSAN